jgi:hypothetical protein
MLAIDFRKSSPVVGITEELSKYLVKCYGESGDAYAEDLATFERLRSNAIHLDVHPNSIESLLR